MMARVAARYALSVFAATELLAGCGGPPPQIAAPHTMPQRFTIATHGNYNRSWMLPEANNEDLLYVSAASGQKPVVRVFDYKSRKMVGALKGFNYPYGQCVDGAGDVWITSWYAKAIVEYAHAGIKRLRTLRTVGEPIGCSVAANGDLAVANSLGNFGKVEVFKGGSSTGTTYSTRQCDPVWTPGYDLYGNLYFEGVDNGSSSYKINVCELPAGRTSLRLVSFDKIIGGLGSIMWDGRYVTLTNTTDTTHTYVYQATEAKSGDLTAVGRTKLLDKSCYSTDVRQVFIVGFKNTPVNKKQGTQVLGGDSYCSRHFDSWAYPAGGEEQSRLHVRFGLGEAVSLAKKP